MIEKRRGMWQFPWRYKESIVIVMGFLLVGFTLQITYGKFDFGLVQYPVNLIIGIVLILLAVLLAVKRRSHLSKFLSGIPFSITLIATITLLGIIMGLTPQLLGPNQHQHDIFTLFGFRQMTSSWPFIIVYCLILLSVGTLIFRRLIEFNWRDYAFYFNHIGLWLLLFSAGLGAADKLRYVMHVREGEVEWRVYSENEDVLELPLGIQLHDFNMEEYPPKLALIHNQTGEVQPKGKPQYLQIEEKQTSGKLLDWDITIDEYIHQAVRNSDSSYQEMPMPGASPAVKITATNGVTGEKCRGWVSAGNVAQLYMKVDLDSAYCIVATKPEPKRFVSDISVFTQQGTTKHALLEVNKPLRVGNWTIYQYSYDTDAGQMSTYSSMELVYDPWLIYSYIGIAMLALGSICLLWSGNKKKKNYDVE